MPCKRFSDCMALFVVCVLRFLLQFGIPISIHERVDRLPLLAERAFVGPVAGVVGNILRGKNGFNRDPVHLRNGAEYGRNASYFAAMVKDAVVAVFQ